MRKALEIQHRVRDIRGSALAAAITLRSFIALFPALLVVIAIVGFVNAASGSVAKNLVQQLGVSGSAARTISDAVQTAERSRRAASIVGVVGLVWAGLTLAVALGSAYDAAWGVENRGIKDRLYQLGWLAGSAVLVVLAFSTAALIDVLPSWFAPVGVVVGVGMNLVLWLWTATVLPNRRIPFRAKLPAALLGSVAVEALKIAGAFVVPRLVAGSSELYGALGVVFALLAWLLVFGRVVVYVAVIEVIGWERRHGTQRETIDVPTLTGNPARP